MQRTKPQPVCTQLQLKSNRTPELSLAVSCFVGTDRNCFLQKVTLGGVLKKPQLSRFEENLTDVSSSAVLDRIISADGLCV